MRTPMLPLVDIVRSSWFLADRPIDTALTTITDVFDFYGGDLVADSGHTLMIGETRYALNYSILGFRLAMTIGSYVPIAVILVRLHAFVRRQHEYNSYAPMLHSEKHAYPIV
jgi:hypothetical protein